ncbi:MAG: hypothetical protein ABIG68_09500, partial [Acidobacteriota bacterium]
AGQEEQSILAQLQMEEVPEDLSPESAGSFLGALRSLRLELRKQQILTKIAEAAEQKDDRMLDRLFEERESVDRELVNLARK